MKVCVVMEYRRAGHQSRGTLFGVYATEDAARKGYGDEDDTYEPQFIMCEVTQ